MIEELKQLYADYMSATDEPEKRGFADIFRGWFTGRGRDMSDTDKNFIASLESCVQRIKNEAPEEAYQAAALILSQPRTKKPAERDILLAAMYSKIPALLSCMSGKETTDLYELTKDVPKQYRFPVYKQLVSLLRERMG